jgi:5-methylcytosine-specific restriction endonuclease McrA
VACKQGRPQLSADQDRRLFAESAGTCLLCNTPLFADLDEVRRSVSLAERAHIVAHSDDGPRADATVPEKDRSDPANIVLLCPNCHTLADKAPEAYPTAFLLAKKATRAAAVAHVGGAPTFQNRSDARRAVETILERNATIFKHSGPDSDGSTTSVEAATEWSRLVLEDIVPGNELIVAIVQLNHNLTTPVDREAAELLRLHTYDLAEKHRTGAVKSPARRFPPTAEQIFTEDHGDR